MKLHRNKNGDVQRVKDIPLETIIRYRGQRWRLVAFLKPAGKRVRAWIAPQNSRTAPPKLIHGNTGVIDTHLF